LRGGHAGLPYRAIVNPGTEAEQHLPGLVDNFALKRGDLIRLLTTGGGGWGDPLEREPESVLIDVIQGKVSARSAREDYGVVLVGRGENLRVDAEATERLRRELAEHRGELPLIDRGPGYERLAAQG
jgi:N-methylhydantoinase B